MLHIRWKVFLLLAASTEIVRFSGWYHTEKKLSRSML